MPPMSTTTASPGRSTRSETSWCGLAAFGPEPTITKSTWVCPSARMASAISVPTSRSVRPALSQPGTRACTRSIAAPASRSASTSAGLLRIRRSRSAELARTWRAPGIASRSRSTIRAHIWSASPATPTGPSRRAIRAYGSSVSSQAIISSPRPEAGDACAAASSSRGTTRTGAPQAGITRQVRRSSCLASYPVT